MNIHEFPSELINGGFMWLVGVVWYMGYGHPTIMNWIPYDWEDDRPLDGKINNLLTVAHMF